MRTIIFDVMCDGRFVMQHKYRWCPAFPLNLEAVVAEIVERRPALKGRHIELYETENVVRSNWCKDNQPYYKKPIPEVVAYLAQKYNIK